MAVKVDPRAARRYAGALFNVAVARGEEDEIARNLATVSSVALESPQLMGVLQHPRITRDQKKGILSKVFQDQVRPDVIHFLLMLVEKDRASMIPSAAKEFARLLDEHRQEADAEAITALPLTPEQETQLKVRLQEATGYKVRLKTRVDERILGGLIVRVGDKLIDASVLSQLEEIRSRLKQIKVN